MGYGDILPPSKLGRIIAVILVLVGIVFIAIITGINATFFSKNEEIKSYKNDIISDV